MKKNLRNNPTVLRLVMLLLFILGAVSGWTALTFVFNVTLWNILLGVVSLFFLLRALEFADIINNFGDYADNKEKNLGEEKKDINQDREEP